MAIVSVLVVNQGITEVGVVANAAFVLGLSAGRAMSAEHFGPEVVDGDGAVHASLTTLGHYVRKAGRSKLSTLRNHFATIDGVTLIDYPEDAAPADYQKYAEDLGLHTGDAISYRAIHIIGPEELVVPPTKNLSRA